MVMLTFIGLAHLHDATLLHVLFNLHNYVMLRYCTFSSIYTTTWCYVDWGGWVGGGDVNVHWTCTLTWCYATARSLQFTQLRGATLLHVLFNLHNYVMLRWLGWGGGWVGGWVGGMLTFIGLAHLRDATLQHVLFNLHNYVMLRYCTFSSICTTTWCYVDWGGGVGGWVGGGDVNVHWHWRNHQNKEFCRLLTDINSTKLSKIAGTQQIDRQLLSLKKFVFSNLHRKVKTLVGSEVNPSLRRRCFQYVWSCNLQTCTPLVMLNELAKLVKNNDADNC